MREDIERALAALDDKGRRAAGKGLPGKVLSELPDLDCAREGVIAVAAARLPQAGMMDGASMSEIRAAALRLIVVTETRFWDLAPKPTLLGRGEVIGNHVVLDRIQDEARLRTGHRPGRLGMKDRFLVFDHLRGGNVATEVYDLSTDSTLEAFTALMNEHLERRREAASRAEPAARHHPPAASAADEIAKLKELLDSGAITSAEYDAMKARMIGS